LGRGIAFDTSAVDLPSAGYTEQEFFISGNARAYVSSGAFGNDGIWNVSPGATAPYVTRMLVRTPTDPEKFNGTVMVEWLNVSGGVDAAPEWDFAHVELLREGYAWVGVTAQFAGAAFLHVYDSTRYASISHPGDSWSYDIYSQVAMAILHSKPRPLLRARHPAANPLVNARSNLVSTGLCHLLAPRSGLAGFLAQRFARITHTLIFVRIRRPQRSNLRRDVTDRLAIVSTHNQMRLLIHFQIDARRQNHLDRMRIAQRESSDPALHVAAVTDPEDRKLAAALVEAADEVDSTAATSR